jgi:lipid A 3-O-deacylase
MGVIVKADSFRPVALAIALLPVPAAAQTSVEPLLSISEIRIGALYHDVPGLWSGFSVEQPSADANFEVLFAPWAKTFGGYLKPAIGATVNFNGDTSKAYADLRWEIEAGSGLFGALGMGAAVHDGELNLVDEDRKALGSRVLFHPSAELGYRFDGVNSVSLFADHMSNGFSMRYNEGMDTLGVRFGHRFAPPSVAATEDSQIADFSGFYIGAAGGYQFERADWNPVSPVSSTPSRYAVAGLMGFNWQSGRGIFGLEADAAPITNTISATCISPDTLCQMDVGYLYSVRPRFGWVIDNSMIYGTGGLAVTTWEARAVNAATAQELAEARTTSYGVAVGAGVEQKFGSNITGRAELMHYGFPAKDLSIPGDGVITNEFQTTVGRLGLSWYFR